MDFVTGLSRTVCQKDAIWVIIDRLTKLVHFIPISEKDPLEKLSKIYVEEIVRLHGVPTSIVSDRDPRFTLKFWEQMQKQFGTTLRFNTTAHPQTDGESERVIQILEDMLRACALDFRNKWVDNMAYAEFAYNNSFQSSIGIAPFEVLYGRKCQLPLYWGKLGRDQPMSETLDLDETQQRVQLIKDRLLTAQSRQKSYVDCQRRELEFSEGELVFLKLTPRRSVGKYKQKKKLQSRYIGPFPIMQGIGKVAYRLELPSELQGIHDVFHVSQLRKYVVDPSHVVNDQNIKMTADLNYDERPIRILQFGDNELR
jgi:hypothetical protein